MNYQAHYDRLIARAKCRVIKGYSERHHILPRCLGGDNALGNLVRLTPEEHYVAHQLLVKIHPGNHRLIWAAMNMTAANGKQAGRKNKVYGWLRRLFAETVGDRSRGRKASEESKAKMAAAKVGKKRQPHSAETKAKMSAASVGRKKTAEHCAALSVARTGKKRSPHADATRKKMSETQQRIAGTRKGDKLTRAQKDEIRSLLGTLKQSEIAARFGVSQSYISDFQTGRKHTAFSG